MAKNSVADWDTTAANNTDVGGIDIDEGCAPSGINNSLREIMAQIASSDLGTLEGLANTDGNFIVGNGSTWVAESGATVRTSLGLTIGTDVQAYDADTTKNDVANTFTEAQTFDKSFPHLHFTGNAGSSNEWQVGQGASDSLLFASVSSGGSQQHTVRFVYAGGIEIDGNPVASVYTGSSASNTDFPIGTIISIDINGYTTGGSTIVGSVPNRAASVSPMVPDYGGGALGGWGPKQFQITGDGTLLSGTWRSRGSIPDRNFLAERVA